jgi:hypothetical protein
MKNGIGPHSGFLELVYGLCASVLIPCRQNDGDAAAGKLPADWPPARSLCSRRWQQRSWQTSCTMELFFAESVRQELSTQPRIYVPACVSWTGHSGSFHEWTKYFRPFNSKPSYFVPKKIKTSQDKGTGWRGTWWWRQGRCLYFIHSKSKRYHHQGVVFCVFNVEYQSSI